MPRLLAANRVPARDHLLEHVPVPDLGSDERDAGIFKRPGQADVGHHRTHNRLPGKLPLSLIVSPAQSQNEIAVKDSASSADRNHPVGISVETEAYVKARLSHLCRESAGIECSTAQVDIPSIRLVADRTNLRPQPQEDLGRDTTGGTVGRIDADLQTVKPIRTARYEIFGVEPERFA